MTSTVVFDGRSEADRIEGQLTSKFVWLKKKLGRDVEIVSAFDPRHGPSRIYTRIKSKFATRVGVVFGGLESKDEEDLESFRSYATDSAVDGLLVQHPNGSLEYERRLVEIVPLAKDVDGLHWNSHFLPATVRAVLTVISLVPRQLVAGKSKLLVVGSKGRVGARLLSELRQSETTLSVEGIDSDDYDVAKLREADIIVSATGQSGLIKGEMVKEGVVCVDVGSPHAEFDADVWEKAGFITPVPGGVGPMTVASLYFNLAQAIDLRLSMR